MYRLLSPSLILHFRLYALACGVSLPFIRENRDLFYWNSHLYIVFNVQIYIFLSDFLKLIYA